MIAIYPGAEQCFTPNYSVSRYVPVLGRIVTPTMIVVHIAQGTEAGARSWFGTRSSKVSSHLFICKDGRVLQFVNLNDNAWTNGTDPSEGYSAYKSDLTNEYIKSLWEHSVNANPFSITIECEGLSGEPIPNAEYNSLIKVIHTVAQMAGFIDERNDFDVERIVGHYQINLVDKPDCPGDSLGIDEIRNDVLVSIRGDNGENMDAKVVKKIEDVLHRLWKLSLELNRIEHSDEAIDLQKEVVEIKKAIGLQ